MTMTDPAAPSRAATLVLIRDRRPSGVEALLLQRHAGSKFAGGDYVFAGGKVEADDVPADAERFCRGLVATDAAARLEVALRAHGLETQVTCGAQAIERVAAMKGVDAVMAAIVGAAGLPGTLAAARAGKDVMLANKEALVVSGALFMKAMAEGGGRLLPIDSEHSAVFQSLPRGFACGRAGELERAGVRRILLTASGGPFRTTPLDRLERVTPQRLRRTLVTAASP